MSAEQILPETTGGRIFKALLIAGMGGCIAWSLVGAIAAIAPEWNGTYLLVVCVLGCLEAAYSYRVVQVAGMRGSEVTRFRWIELGMLFLLVRAAIYIGWSPAEIMADVKAWPKNLGRMFDPEPLVAFVCLLMFWLAATRTIHDLERLRLPEEQQHEYGKASPFDSLGGRFLYGGFVLIVTSGLALINLREITNLTRPSVPGIIVNMLIYFLLGLVIMGQVRYSAMQRSWQGAQVEVSSEVGSRWRSYSLLFVGAAAVLAFVLPTGYTFGLLDVAKALFGFGGLVIWGVSTLIIVVIIQPIMWLLSQLFNTEYSPPEVRDPPPVIASGTGDPGTTSSLFELLRSVLFWAIALGIIFFIVRLYFRDHPGLLQPLKGATLGRLRDWWRALLRQLRVLGRTIQELLPAGKASGAGHEQARPFRLFRLGSASPREQVLYYYLSLLRRAGQAGLPRGRQQTPAEYRERLRPALPENQQEVDSLTDAFVEARYAPYAVDEQRAGRARADWGVLKTALRRLRSGGDGGKKP